MPQVAEEIEKLRRAQDDLNEEYRAIADGIVSRAGTSGGEHLAEWLAALHAWEFGRRAEAELVKLIDSVLRKGEGGGGG